MRRLISFVLAVTLILGCFATTASATEPTYEDSKKVDHISEYYNDVKLTSAGSSKYQLTKNDAQKVPVLYGGQVVMRGYKTATPSINFTFGQKAYYPLVDASGSPVTDAAYVELAAPVTFKAVTTGAGANDLTFGTDYEVYFEKKPDFEGNERYFLVFDVKTNSNKTNGHINGTFTFEFKAGNTWSLIAKKRVFDPKSVVAVNLSPLMTKAPEGFIATRDYSGIKGTSSPTYLHYGKTTYFTLQNNVNTTCDDDNYVNVSGITTNWTEGGEYVEKIELVKEYYNTALTTAKYYLAITMKEGDANATEKLAGTITLQHNNDNYGYNGTNLCKLSVPISFEVQGKPEVTDPGSDAVEADRVTAIQDTTMMTKAPQGYIASRGYGGISGMAAPTYFQYGKTTYFTLKDGSDTIVTDERYLNLEQDGITADWTEGGEYVEKIELVKEYYNTALTTAKYYLAITLKDDASAPDYANLVGTVTLSHNDPDFGYMGTDGKITVSFDKEIWRANGAKEPYRIPKEVDGVTISSGTDGAANAVLLTSTLPVMVEGPNGDVGFYGYDGSEGAVTYLKRGATSYFPIVDKNGDLVTEEKFVKNSLSKAATKWAVSGNNVDTGDLTVKIVKKSNSAGVDQYYFAVTVADNGTDLNSELYYAFGWIDDNFNWSETTAGGYARTVIRKQVQPAGEVDYDRVIGVNETLPMVMTQEGYVATRGWDRLATTPKPNYLEFGEKLYFTLKDAVDTIVDDEKYIEGYTVDLSGLNGAEYIEEVKIEKARYGTSSKEKYYVTVTATKDTSLGNGTLSGAIKITNNTPGVGFNAPDYTVSLTLNMPVGSAVEGRVKTVSNILQCMYQNQVFYQTISGEATTKVTNLPFGNTAYFQLINESGGDVTEFNYVDEIEITHTFDPAIVADVAIVSERYMDDVSDTRYYVAVTFVEQTEESEDTLVEGTITLKKGDGTGEYDVVGGSVTSSAVSFTLTVVKPIIEGTPTEGDSRRVHHFMQLGTNNIKIWPLVENDDGRPDRYENGYGRGQVTSSETVINYGGNLYYMLADCEGRPVTDYDFVENIKITADIESYGNLIDEIKIVKTRLADGIPVNGVHSKDLYCYFLKISFVERDIVYRVPVTGYITLYKKGDEGIATKDNELELFVDVRVGRLDATQDESQWNREFFGDRTLSDVPTRYKFADPSFEEGGAYNAVGTDPHDVIYFTEDQDAYITVSTKNQGAILLHVNTNGEDHLWDLYGAENELKFYMGNNAKFLHMGVITIEQPDDGWCLYRVRGGMLYEADDAKFDEKAKAWNIRTRELGQFCLSDKPLDLDLQYTTELDPFKFVPKGTSINKPTDMLDVDILNQVRLENTDSPAIDHYVLSEFTVNKEVSEWFRKTLKTPINLNSKFGWTVSIDPKDIPAEINNKFTLAPFCTDAPNSVMVDMVGYLEDNDLEYPVTVTVTRKKLQDLKAVAVYGKTDSGKLVHICDADTSDGTVQFKTVVGVDSYVITNQRRDSATLKQFEGAKNA